MPRIIPADAQAAAKRIYAAAVKAAQREGLTVTLITVRNDVATFVYSPLDSDDVLALLSGLVAQHRPEDLTLNVAIEDEDA